MISQRDFDTILFGIRGQGGPAAKENAVNHSVFCQYRTESGRKCAAGWLLPDGDPEATLDQTGFARELTFFKANFQKERGAISNLQSIHDNAAVIGETGVDGRLATDQEFFSRWEPQMEKFAQASGLTYIPPSGV